MAENILAIIPVKDLTRTKSRLREVLSPSERRAFTLGMLSRTVQVLTSSNSVEGILISTPDDRVLSYAKELGVPGLKEEGRGLNRALQQATRWSMDLHFGAVLVIPCDLPLLRVEDIRALVEPACSKEKVVVIAPNEDRSGTNGLLVKPPGMIRYAFGANSFWRHQSWAYEQQLNVVVYSSPSIAFDLDRPEQCRSPFARRYFLNKVVDDENRLRTFDPYSGCSPYPAAR
jgi:2-phospho-L-lactate guanylyltransferase